MLRVFTNERCLEHSVPFGFPEVAERLSRVVEACREAGLEIVETDTHPRTDSAISAVHDDEYVERFRRASERGDGLICSSDNPLSAGTWDAARAGVDTILAAADWVAGAAGRSAFAAVRPPGHHAERDQAMGFCYFNNVAVAAEYLRRELGLGRIAIYDPDVHHGNGTQHIFEASAEVLYASTHQYPFYPGTGSAAEVGIGEGAGATVNVPLPAATADDAYAVAVDERILPALRSFEPDALLISAGFDAWRGDPLGGMQVSGEEIERWGSVLGDLAREVCSGRALVTLEGGYDLEALGQLAARFVSALGAAVSR